MRGIWVLLVVAAACGYPRPDDVGPPGDAPSPDSPDASPVDGDASFCPSGYTFRTPTSCVRLVNTALAWTDAEADCEVANAHLAVINNNPENADLPANAWIGISSRKGTMQWVTGVPITYLSFAAGEPDNSGPCVHASPDGWHDVNCLLLKSYVCEYDGSSADPSTF